MGIAPVWRLRDAPGGEADGPAGDEAAVPAPPDADRPPAAAGVVAAMDWPTLRQTIAECTACGLCRGRRQAVPGVGDENADWLFIGEGPGAEEDARGEPFVGQAGRLLDAMLAAIDLQRGDNVYIANAVKCRPPGNRTPEPEEMAACWPYLQRQIALLRPKLIVLLGRAAMQAVLNEARPLGASRGKLFEYRDGELVVPVIVTYHPAYLLRNLPDKAKAWEDLCFARRTMRQRQAAGTDLPRSGD
ncbi:MAG: uracil-DNA glycosylase [Rhodocyclaceae bacterium]|nr:uracil-DNA glycosylase [Rhodocyclaceae bacterium]